MKAKANPFRAAWRAGVPLVCIETADPAATVRGCIAALNGKQASTAILQWDCVSGVSGKGDASQELATTICAPQPPEMVTNPAEFLSMLAINAKKLRILGEDEKPGRCLVFLHHFNRFINSDKFDTTPIMQGLWNCRDTLKPYGAMLVSLGPVFTIPAELKNDIVLISEPLPGAEEIGKIIESVAADAGLEASSIPDRERIVDTLTGVSAFGAEQVLAMSITRDGVDQETLTERQRLMIEQTKGLSVWRGGETFDDLGGLSNLKGYLTRILKSGKMPVNALLFGDEIEKQFAGIGGDTSGTSSDQFGQVLQFLNDYRVATMILLGPGGTGKSAIAKAAGKITGAPVLAMDFGAMKGSLVGQSEERIRDAIKVAVSVSNGKLAAIFTCNKLSVLPPEFKRRATLGTFMVDLPDAESRKAIWRVHMKALGIPDQALPDDRDWTGAEIRACCENAYRAEYSLIEASAFVVPIAKSDPASVKALRTLAHNSFISASYKGVYKMPKEDSDQPLTGRVMER